MLRKCGAEDVSPHTIYCTTSHCGRNLCLCTFPDHAKNELSCVSYHRQSKKKHLLWNNTSKWTVWLYLWSCSMGICRRCIFPSSSCSERSSLPYLIPLHECSCSGIHCLLMLSIQCTHCASSSAWKGIKIFCSSQTNIFKMKPCARKDFRNSRS